MDSDPWTAPVSFAVNTAGLISNEIHDEVLSGVKVAVMIIKREGILLQMVSALMFSYELSQDFISVHVLYQDISLKWITKHTFHFSTKLHQPNAVRNNHDSEDVYWPIR